MKQQPLLTLPTPPAPAATDHAERDMFGNPITSTGEPAPTYRPRKPVQQTLDLNPGTFTLT